MNSLLQFWKKHELNENTFAQHSRKPDFKSNSQTHLDERQSSDTKNTRNIDCKQNQSGPRKTPKIVEIRRNPTTKLRIRSSRAFPQLEDATSVL